jgi:hypothetical protein
MSARTTNLNWNVAVTDPPKLVTWQWWLSGLIGVVLLIAAVLQLISFSDFRDNLGQMGLPGPTAWAVCIILAEIWGAATFFRLRLSYAFRAFSVALAVLVSGFWFVEHLQLISSGKAEHMTNSNFFGRFLAQQPGWWTVIEVSVMLFLVIWFLDVARPSVNSRRRR